MRHRCHREEDADAEAALMCPEVDLKVSPRLTPTVSEVLVRLQPQSFLITLYLTLSVCLCLPLAR